jgi:hypothetical protein
MGPPVRQLWDHRDDRVVAEAVAAMILGGWTVVMIAAARAV